MVDLFIGYIDPGTGSILLQLLLGGVVGAGVFFRRVLMRVMEPLWKVLGKVKSEE